ncbi:hypothetical protein [Chengkuizengella marina]|uniref:Toxin ETX/toxin MTX2 n=1 Tax=Chengkuizengella marina TaxID=2507566 RepID=A0A6N9Q5N9_9BACL|nr:hypothetical protein [Chengkuizengella marina]NBI30185.1 hypothetical protein [Chengkuizengella marina]
MKNYGLNITKKRKRLLVNLFLTFSLLFTMAAESGASSYITTKDFMLDDNRDMIEMGGFSTQASLLPPLEELLPWNSYDIGLPSNTRNYTNQVEDANLIDYIAIDIYSRGNSMSYGEFLELTNPYLDDMEYIFADGEGDTWIYTWSNKSCVGGCPIEHEIPDDVGFPFEDIPTNPDGFLAQARYYSDTQAAQESKVKFEGYWELVDGQALQSNNGGRISQAYTVTSGVDISAAYSLAETIGTKISTESGFLFGKVSTEINNAITETFSFARGISQYSSATTTFNFGDINPNGIPYIGGIYQLVGTYSAVPGQRIKNLINNLNREFYARHKSEISVQDVLYRQVQIDYIEP